MKKNIIILNGSPRINGNTSFLIKDFMEGAKKAGHRVTCFNLHKMNIHGCLGCMRGGKNIESPCIQKDDMDQIYPAYTKADIVVLASPLYYWNISGQLKCAFDRLFAIAECNEDYANPQKECVLLMSAEGNEFEEITNWYSNLCKHLNWTDKGQVLCGNITSSEDMIENAMLDKAYQLGETL